MGDEHHRRRRQDHPGCGRAGEPIGCSRSAGPGQFLADAAALRVTHPTCCRGPRTTSRQIVALIQTLLDGARLPRPTTARSSSGSRPGRRTACWPGSTRSCGSASGSRPTSTQGRRPRFRALEGTPSPASRRWSTGHRARAGRVAHRVLRDVDEPPGSLRHPHRGRGPDLSPPRGRDRGAQARPPNRAAVSGRLRCAASR